MRRALLKCATPSQPVLLDFLAPRLLTTTTHNPCRFTKSSWLLRPTSSTRCYSVEATARSTNSKLSILDVTGGPENDLSHYASQMRKCALDRDVLGVWAAYRHIENKYPRLVLGPEHYGATSIMLLNAFSDPDGLEKRKGDELRMMEELAFVCVGAGYAEGFRQMLLCMLAKGQPERVIKAYERLERTVLDLDESGLEKATDNLEVISYENEGESSQPRLENPDISRVDAADIMAITLAAHAQLDKFSEALQLVLRRTSHRVTRDNVLNLGRDLQTYQIPEVDELLAQTSRYAEATGMAKLVQKPEVFKAHIRNLLKEKIVERRLQNVKRILSSGFFGKTRWAVTDEAQLNPDRHLFVTVSQKVWAILMYAFIVARMDDEAEKLWATILRIGYSPKIDMWNGLLEGYRDTHQVERLLLTWDVMKKERIPLNATSYGARIACLFQARRATLAMKTFDEFKRSNPNQEDGLLFVFNTILNGYLLEKRLTDAVKLLGEMKKHGPQPDIVSYNTFIAHYAKRADLRGVADFVRQLTEAGVEPDVFTFTTILSAFLRAGIPNGTTRLLEVMQSIGVKQNVATYSAIINAQVREGTREGVRAAWELLQQMERMKDTRPNIVTYTSFLAGVHRSQELDKQLVSLITSEVVKTMKRRGVQLKLGTYHVLFKACLENLNPEGKDFFMDYYNMLVRSGIPFRHDTWYIILNGLIRRDAWTLAKEMKDRMLGSGFQAMWGVMEMVKSIEEWEVRNR